MSRDPELRAAAGALAAALAELHKVAMEAAAAAYERERGPIGGRVRLLELLMGDAFFAWLRPLSGLMADLDEGLDDTTPLDDAAGGDLRAATEALLDRPGALHDGLHPLLQDDTNLVLASGAVRRALAALPATAREGDPRARWNTRRRKRGRLN